MEIKKLILRNDLIIGNLPVSVAACPKTYLPGTQASVQWHVRLTGAVRKAM